MSVPKVVLIGLRPSSVDYEKWPELSPEKLEAAFAKVRSALVSEGYSARWCLTDTGETAESQVEEVLGAEDPDIVLIGAGVRADPDHLLLFERIINLVHRIAPGARIVFNRDPFDSVDAVKRWS